MRGSVIPTVAGRRSELLTVACHIAWQGHHRARVFDILEVLARERSERTICTVESAAVKSMLMPSQELSCCLITARLNRKSYRESGRTRHLDRRYRRFAC